VLQEGRSLKSLPFTLKNPHNFLPTTFPLKTEMKDKAIFYDSSGRANICDTGVSDQCNANDVASYTYLATLTPPEPSEACYSFSRVRGISLSSKSKYSGSPTK
jgi:hypothetical protein